MSAEPVSTEPEPADAGPDRPARHGLRAAVTATLVAVPVAVLTGVAVTWFSGDGEDARPSASPEVATAPRAGSTAPVVVPGPAASPLTGADTAPCRALVAALPRVLAGRPARPVAPPGATGRAPAWGDPAVVLRCGVGRPAVPTGPDQVLSIDGVSWLTSGLPGGGTRWSLLGSAVAVQVDVPAALAEESGSTLMPPLAVPITASLPTG